MPEQRARQIHRNRVRSTFAEEITAMLEGELTDPRIASCHVTEVVLAPGGKSCRVFIAVTGGEEDEESTLEGLMAARGYIRTEIRGRKSRLPLIDRKRSTRAWTNCYTALASAGRRC